MKNKDLTKRNLIAAVGQIIQTEGFNALNVSKVARAANVDRKLVYRYFGNLDGLVEAYVVENDYWMSFSHHISAMLLSSQISGSQELITKVLQDQFRFFSQEKDMQNLILMELSEKNELLQSIHRARESLGERLLEITDQHFRNGSVDLRAVVALLVGGIYYVVLHTRHNGNKFANLDLGNDSDHDALHNAIAQVISWAYQEASGNCGVKAEFP